jgi:hypothetical protein
MKCAFCGYEFKLEQAAESCAACPIARGCHLVRCPRCGYEMPQEARLVTWLRRRLRRPDTVRTPESFTYE